MMLVGRSFKLGEVSQLPQDSGLTKEKGFKDSA
jgi:hypothetical protein